MITILPHIPVDFPNNPSEEYWKLYDQYAEIRQKLADAEDLIDATKRELDDAKAECKLKPSKSAKKKKNYQIV
jgi:ABC-type Fe3+-hydroxamate transport system substrate-binding protein